jgi:hypothetical protein
MSGTEMRDMGIGYPEEKTGLGSLLTGPGFFFSEGIVLTEWEGGEVGEFCESASGNQNSCGTWSRFGAPFLDNHEKGCGALHRDG